MRDTKDKKKKSNEQLIKRIDALEVSLLMLINSLRNVKNIKIKGEEYHVVGKIPEVTLKMLESMIVKNK